MNSNTKVSWQTIGAPHRGHGITTTDVNKDGEIIVAVESYGLSEPYNSHDASGNKITAGNYPLMQFDASSLTSHCVS